MDDKKTAEKPEISARQVRCVRFMNSGFPFLATLINYSLHRLLLSSDPFLFLAS